MCFSRSKIELGDVTPHNIKQLKLLNQVVFPVSYNEKFYKDVLEAGELAKLAYYNDIVVRTLTRPPLLTPKIKFLCNESNLLFHLYYNQQNHIMHIL